jgi:hypothetical protein
MDNPPTAAKFKIGINPHTSHSSDLPRHRMQRRAIMALLLHGARCLPSLTRSDDKDGKAATFRNSASSSRMASVGEIGATIAGTLPPGSAAEQATPF